MKYKIILLFILFLQSYKPLTAQPGDMVVDYDYCFFSLKNKDITSVNSSIFYNKNFFLFLKYCLIRKTHSEIHYLLKSSFVFAKENDTMTVLTYLPYLSNYYIKDLEFKKGSYFLKVSNHKKLEEVNGLDIETQDYMQNILLKKDLFGLDETLLFKKDRFDVNFKDLKFTVIDLRDTLNIQLEPMSRKDFNDINYYSTNVEGFWDAYLKIKVNNE
jgi:hypothetical protein